jgi:plastocyanin
MRSPITLFVAAVAMLTLGACGGGGNDESAGAAANGSGARVTVETFNFQPDPITVDAGTTITFVNEDEIDHTVTAGTRAAPTPEVFNGELPGRGATFELTLDEPGTYDYFCNIHPGQGMTGRIIVT